MLVILIPNTSCTGPISNFTPAGFLRGTPIIQFGICSRKSSVSGSVPTLLINSPEVVPAALPDDVFLLPPQHRHQGEVGFSSLAPHGCRDPASTMVSQCTKTRQRALAHLQQSAVGLQRGTVRGAKREVEVAFEGNRLLGRVDAFKLCQHNDVTHAPPRGSSPHLPCDDATAGLLTWLPFARFSFDAFASIVPKIQHITITWKTRE